MVTNFSYMIVINVGFFGRESRSVLVKYLKCVFKNKSFLLLGLEEWERHVPSMHDFCYILLLVIISETLMLVSFRDSLILIRVSLRRKKCLKPSQNLLTFLLSK